MCSWHKQLPHVIGVGPQWATTYVRQKATVVCEVRGSRSNKRLTYEPRDLEHNPLTYWLCIVSVGHKPAGHKPAGTRARHMGVTSPPEVGQKPAT